MNSTTLYALLSGIVPADAAIAAEADTSTLEEITVTAQKRSQRLVDVPISVAVFGDEAIKATGVQQLSEISDLIPNLHIDSVRSLSSAVTIRGVGASSRNIGFDARTLEVDMLLLHYTGMQIGQDALARLCDPQWKVSAHYLVKEDGCVYQLVDEARRARHAGVSFWQGETDTNSRSVGIEIVNPGHEWGYRPFPEAQISAVIELSRQIMSRHNILRRHVLGHSDVAADRKTDPGELFPWDRLAEKGIGIALPIIDGLAIREGGRLLTSPDVENEVAKRAEFLLVQIGYDSAATGCWDQHSMTNMIAFQRHFYPRRLDGLVDEGGLLALEKVTAAMDADGTH